MKLYAPLLAALAAQSVAVYSKNCQDGYEFDFIIVGGGTAGLTVAGRLSEGLPSQCVLVLEAGPDGRHESNIYIPGRKGSTFATEYDWNFTSIPQEACNGRLIPYWRARTLGGCSAHNFMLWNGAAADEYNSWERLGNPGWNWENIHAAMYRSENFAPSPEYDGNGLGASGPVHSSIGPSYRNQTLSFFSAMENNGLERNEKSMDGTPLGVMWQPSSIRPTNYTRSYSVEYINAPRSNLQVRTESRVTRLNFDESNTTVTGVTLTDGTELTARKEVILSAGALQSPQILELSGIGQTSILEAAGIHVIHDLPGVGENLQDHPRIPTVYRLKPPLFSADRLRYDSEYAQEQMSRWNQSLPSEYGFTLGPTVLENWHQVSSELAIELTALAKRTVDQSNPVNRERLRFLDESSTGSNKVPEAEILLTDSYNGVKGYPSTDSPDFGSSFTTILAVLQHPFSTGTVHINSSSIDAWPVIDPRMLSHEYDAAAMTALTKYTRRIANTYPLSEDWVGPPYEPEGQDLSDAEWEAFTRDNVLSIYHPVGTCSMLPEAQGGVVDPELKVYGVKGLRVVDASIIPLLLSGHPQTVVYGIGERAADLIVREWSRST